jgi:energy-coupling factor transporter ATP-binding protein EcfA2
MTGLHKRRAVTLVLVTHDHALAAEAQRQIILRDGRVVSDTERSRDTEIGRRGDAVTVGDTETGRRGDAAKGESEIVDLAG